MSWQNSLMIWQNSLTIPWDGSKGQNSLTFFHNSLTFPWPGENFVFPWHFPDMWQPWDSCFCSLPHWFQQIKCKISVIHQLWHKITASGFESFIIQIWKEFKPEHGIPLFHVTCQFKSLLMLHQHLLEIDRVFKIRVWIHYWIFSFCCRLCHF